MKTIRSLLTLAAIALAFVADAQVYPYYPPPGTAYSSAASGPVNFKYVNSTSSPAFTIGNALGTLTGSPTINLLDGGTGNNLKISGDDTLVLSSGNGGTPFTSFPSGFTPGNGDVLFCAPLGSDGTCLDVGKNNDSVLIGETNADGSLVFGATGSTASTTASIGAWSDFSGTTGIIGLIGCTNANGFLDTGAGGVGLLPQVTGAPHIKGCYIGGGGGPGSANGAVIFGNNLHYAGEIFPVDFGLQWGTPTGGDKGTGTINAQGLFVQGAALQAISCANNEVVFQNALAALVCSAGLGWTDSTATLTVGTTSSNGTITAATVTNASGRTLTFNASNGNGSNASGGRLLFNAGSATGTGTGGDLVFTAGASDIGGGLGRAGNVVFTAGSSGAGNEGIVQFVQTFGTLSFGVDVDGITPLGALSFVCGASCSAGGNAASIQVENSLNTNGFSAEFHAINSALNILHSGITAVANTASPLSGGPTGQQTFSYSDVNIPYCLGTNVVMGLCISGTNQGVWLNGATGSSQGSGTLNATGLFVNGTAVPATTTGTFTETFTGFTANPTCTGTWSKVGPIVVLTFCIANTTSNATTFTMTGLPAAIQIPALDQSIVLAQTAIFNGSAAAGSPVEARMVHGSGTITFTFAGSATGWTNAGTKGFAVNESITYQLQ